MLLSYENIPEQTIHGDDDSCLLPQHSAEALSNVSVIFLHVKLPSAASFLVMSHSCCLTCQAFLACVVNNLVGLIKAATLF